MPTYSIDFFDVLNKYNTQTPYIHGEAIEYNCDGKEGYVRFNGYYRVEDDAPPYPELPRILFRPYSEYLPQIIGMAVSVHGENIIQSLYKIEVYKRVSIENTGRFSLLNIQTIYFRVLGEL